MSKKEYLLLALKNAKRGKGHCAPNPAVGAVIVKDNKVLAQGYHQGAGKAHAEVVAIQQLQDDQCHGAELYVTLEPCNHFGRTPPCSELIIAKQFKAVYFGFADPNPDVKGQGQQRLQKAGIECQQIQLPEITSFYQSYEHWSLKKNPFVTAKIALSLDGKVSISNNKSTKLTGNVADEYTHQQRLYTDALLSTVKTVVVDNPKLNARLADGNHQKKLFLLDSELELSLDLNIFKTTESITLFYRKDIEPKSNLPVTYRAVQSQNGHLDLLAILEYLGKNGIHDLWVEAGPTLLNSLLQQRLINRLIIYISPVILGSNAIASFTKAYNLPKPSWQVLGSDIMAVFNF